MALCDVGCMSLSSNQLMLFGGESDQTQDKVYVYTNSDPHAEGSFAVHPKSLAQPDSFPHNGVFLSWPD